MMTEPVPEKSNPLLSKLPLIVILLVAVLGAFFLRDYLSFETLRDNREALIAFRDSNYLLTVLCPCPRPDCAGQVRHRQDVRAGRAGAGDAGLGAAVSALPGARAGPHPRGGRPGGAGHHRHRSRGARYVVMGRPGEGVMQAGVSWGSALFTES